jgi:hypothetical protein
MAQNSDRFIAELEGVVKDYILERTKEGKDANGKMFPYGEEPVRMPSTMPEIANTGWIPYKAYKTMPSYFGAIQKDSNYYIAYGGYKSYRAAIGKVSTKVNLNLTGQMLSSFIVTTSKTEMLKYNSKTFEVSFGVPKQMVVHLGFSNETAYNKYLALAEGWDNITGENNSRDFLRLKDWELEFILNSVNKIVAEIVSFENTLT